MSVRDAGPRAAAPIDRSNAPSPLVAHLAGAARTVAAGAALGPLAADDRFPWETTRAQEGRAAGRALAEIATDNEIGLALWREGARRLSAMVAGLDAYRAAPPTPRPQEPPVIWTEGAARLLDYGAAPEARDPRGPVALVIPSLVNRAHVLDLTQARSAMRRLAAAGLRPLLLDWGAPGAAERAYSLSDYVAGPLARALDAALALDGGRVALIGYCMGGSFAAALAHGRGEAVRAAGLVGAPWRFEGLDGGRGALARAGAPLDAAGAERAADAIALIFGCAPALLAQGIFAELDPALALRKFRRFAATPPDTDAAAFFVALEDWLHVGPDLTAPAARELYVDWHVRNLTGRGLWAPLGAKVRPEEIAAPALVALSPRDRIAPPDCALALAESWPGAEALTLASGHVGMVVGRRAAGDLWAPMAEFLLRDRAAPG